MWLQVEAAWGAAPAQVVISGAVGPRAVFVNGRFEQVEREVYCEVGDPDKWLFVNKEGKWTVGTTASKDARKTESGGWAHSVASAGGMLPLAGAGRWMVDLGTFGNANWAEQTVQVDVISAAQAREWATRHAEQVGHPGSRSMAQRPPQQGNDS